MMPVFTSTPLHHNDTNKGIMMKVILIVLVSIAVTSACVGIGSDCETYTECKCGSERETCCSKTFQCQGASITYKDNNVKDHHSSHQTKSKLG